MKKSRKTKFVCIFLLSAFATIQAFSNVNYFLGNDGDGKGEVREVLQTQNVITGTVTDQAGQTLIGVTVLVKGTMQGTITDVNGEYTLDVGEEAEILVFSYIGMKTQEITIGTQSVIDVILEEDIAGLEEVIVVGYGTQKKINLSGAVDHVDAEELASRPITNISQGLQGIVPNLNIDFNSGEPGKAAEINIRGMTSINAGEPLILIDGVPSDAIELNRLTPQDVESISVLKDASSAAIYGARAAFGVILITTKSGMREGIHVTYNNNLSWEKPTVLPNKITDPYIYLRLKETSTDNTPWDNMNFSDETYLWAKQRSEDPSLPGVRINPNDPTSWEYMGDKDWTEYFLAEYAFSQKHHITIDGSTAKTRFYLSGAYDTQSGALKIADDVFDRYSIRSKVDYQLFEWATIGNNTVITTTDRTKPSYLNIGALYDMEPYDWDKNPDGTWANSDLTNNIGAASVGETGARLTQGGTENDKYTNIQSTFTGELSFWERMVRVNADFTVRRGNDNYRWNYSKYKLGYGPGDVREIGNNEAYRSTTFDNYTVFNIYGTFDKDFGPHHLTAIAGYNQEQSRSEWFKAEKTKVISASLPTIALATGEAYVDESIAGWAIRGAFYRLNYTFMEKYILELNGRFDGSSKFPSDDRFGFFPSASGAWRVDREGFMAPLENIVSMLKLRGSYGSLGNQFVTEYGYIPSMTAYLGSYLIGGSLPQAVSAPPLVSSNYTWEQVTSMNFGLDLGLMDNKLTASFDYYVRDTEGMLTQGKDLPDVLGASEPRENAADLETKGWELSLDYKTRFTVGNKPLSVNARFILSDNTSTITSFDNPNKNLIQFYEGMELGEIWGLQNDGLFQNQTEIDALDETEIIPWGALSIVPGWPKYKDLDGNGLIEKGLTVDDPKDLSVIGNFTPRYRYAVNINLAWNGIDFRAFFQGIGKRDYYPVDYLYWGFYQQPYTGGYVHLNDFYRANDDSDIDRARHSQSYIDAGLADQNLDAKFPVFQSWLADRNLGERIDESEGLAIPQTGYMLDGSYLRLKNLTIGYTLPSSITERANIGRVRIYISGENIATWSELKEFYDPEAITATSVKLDPSVSAARISTGSGYAYPFQKSYSFGINVTF